MVVTTIFCSTANDTGILHEQLYDFLKNENHVLKPSRITVSRATNILTKASAIR